MVIRNIDNLVENQLIRINPKNGVFPMSSIHHQSPESIKPMT